MSLLQGTGVAPGTIDRNRKDLYYENWDFDIQQQLPRSLVLSAGYQGSQGHKLPSPMTYNLINPATGARYYPQFAAVGVKANYGNSNFNALQVSVKRSFSTGFLWQTQYQWAKAITDASVGAAQAGRLADRTEPAWRRRLHRAHGPQLSRRPGHQRRQYASADPGGRSSQPDVRQAVRAARAGARAHDFDLGCGAHAYLCLC